MCEQVMTHVAQALTTFHMITVLMSYAIYLTVLFAYMSHFD
jgi:hypothetical protein